MAEQIIVTSATLNLRAGPGTMFAIVTQLTQGTQLEVLAASESDWLHVLVVGTGQTGYVANAYISRLPGDPTISPKPPKPTNKE